VAKNLLLKWNLELAVDNQSFNKALEAASLNNKKVITTFIKPQGVLFYSGALFS
jgi:hypothetical protein